MRSLLNVSAACATASTCHCFNLPLLPGTCHHATCHHVTCHALKYCTMCGAGQWPTLFAASSVSNDCECRRMARLSMGGRERAPPNFPFPALMVVDAVAFFCSPSSASLESTSPSSPSSPSSPFPSPPDEHTSLFAELLRPNKFPVLTPRIPLLVLEVVEDGVLAVPDADAEPLDDAFAMATAARADARNSLLLLNPPNMLLLLLGVMPRPPAHAPAPGPVQLFSSSLMLPMELSESRLPAWL